MTKYDVHASPRPGSYLPWSRHDTRADAERELALRPGRGEIHDVAPIYPAGWKLRGPYLSSWHATKGEAEAEQRAHDWWADATIREVGPEYPRLSLDIAPPAESPMGRNFSAIVAESAARAEHEKWLNS